MNQPEAAQADDTYLAELRADSVLLLTSVRSTLAALLRAVVASGGPTKEVMTKQLELESALKRAFDAEQKYHDWLDKSRDRLAPGEIDLDAIRTEIGCRLHRLRSCCADDRLS